MRHIHMQSLVTSVVLTLMSWAVAAGAEMQEFLISYWGGPPAEETTLERYREIAECGFNVVMPPANDADVPTNLKILDLCAELGLKAIIADNRMPEAAGELSDEKKQALDALVADYTNHPALAGYFIRDEPPTRLLPAVAAIHRYLLEKDPHHLPFVNLYPNYAKPARFDDKGYEDHVAQFIELVQPRLVSWDHYKQMAGDESLYFLNLNTIRQQCLKANLPYVQIILALPHWSYRNPSEADLRWQVYTSLAYGVRGIMYFTYLDTAGLEPGRRPGDLRARRPTRRQV
ncbi:MAG: hypothetical protein IT445_00565 [Phycisphaeraceae bacterium]|nr:hypothetical protein [Phycisphaeraceae bacterium]